MADRFPAPSRQAMDGQSGSSCRGAAPSPGRAHPAGPRRPGRSRRCACAAAPSRCAPTPRASPRSRASARTYVPGEQRTSSSSRSSSRESRSSAWTVTGTASRATGHARARQVVEALAADALGGERRRHLPQRAHQRAAGRAQRLVAHRDRPRLVQRLAREVVGGGREAEPDGRAVGLLALRQEARQARGLADADRQHAGRERVERARVADAPLRPALAGRGRRRRARSGPAGLSTTSTPCRSPPLALQSSSPASRVAAGSSAADLVEQLRHAVGGVQALVVLERDLGRVADAQAAAQLAPHEARGLPQAGEALVPRRLVAQHADVDRARGAGRA